MNENNKNKNKTMFIIIAVAVLLLIIGGIVAFSILSSPMRNFKNSIQNDDYETALEIYEDNFIDDDKNTNEISSILIDNINLKYNDYINEVISKDDIINILKDIVEFDIEKVKETVSEVNTTLKEISSGRDSFVMAEEEFNNGNWQDAITYYSSVSKDDTTYYSKAQNQITTCSDNYKKDIEEQYQKYLDDGDYISATEIIEIALTYLPNDEDLKSKLENIENVKLENQLQDIKEEASQYELDDDLLNAYLTIDSAIDEFGTNNEELNQLLEDYKEKYINSIITEVEEYININDYKNAQSTLEDAISKIGQNETLTEKLADIKNNTPVSLADVKAINKNGYDLCNYEIEDSFGNTYADNAMGLASQYNHEGDEENISYAELYLDKKYSKFIATIGIYDGSSEDEAGIIEIYADNKLIYTSPVLNRSTKPFDIDLDVSKVEWFKIVLKPNEITKEGKYTPDVIIGNAIFTVSNNDDAKTTTQATDETTKETEDSNKSTITEESTSKNSKSN